MTYRSNNLSGGEAVFGCVVILVLIALVFAVFAGVFMFLWNAVVPALFGGPVIEYPMAVGMVLLLYLIGRVLGIGGTGSKGE